MSRFELFYWIYKAGMVNSSLPFSTMWLKSFEFEAKFGSVIRGIVKHVFATKTSRASTQTFDVLYFFYLSYFAVILRKHELI